MTSPNTALTYGDLVLAVAEKLGIAYYGANGDEVAQSPNNTYEFDRCRRIVQDGIRMFMADAPVGGWRWQRPTAEVNVWPTVPNGTNKITAVYAAGPATTTITAVSDVFVPSMVTKTIAYTAAGGAGTWPILAYVSPRVVTISGDHAAAAVVFSVTADGNYTLPAAFSGEVAGGVTVAPKTTRTNVIDWSDPVDINTLRLTPATGYTTTVAYQVNAVNSALWDIMVYPTPAVADVLEFPYKLAFTGFTTNVSDPHPAGYEFDDCVRAACLAKAERDAEDGATGLTEYYEKKSLPNAWKIDAPKALSRWIGRQKWGRQAKTPPTPERT